MEGNTAVKNFKTVNLPQQLDLYECLEDMLKKNKIVSMFNQICLNAPIGKEDDYLLGCGSLFLDWTKIDCLEGLSEKQIPRREKIYEEHEFTELCDVFKNTRFEQLYKDLQNSYNVGRVRIMTSLPKTCLSWHVDSSPRLHYPIKTQEGCFMVIEDEVYHLPQNQWTLTNTLAKHTAFNASFEKRVHIVASVLDNYEN